MCSNIGPITNKNITKGALENKPIERKLPQDRRDRAKLVADVVTKRLNSSYIYPTQDIF